MVLIGFPSSLEYSKAIPRVYNNLQMTCRQNLPILPNYIKHPTNDLAVTSQYISIATNGFVSGSHPSSGGADNADGPCLSTTAPKFGNTHINLCW